MIKNKLLYLKPLSYRLNLQELVLYPRGFPKNDGEFLDIQKEGYVLRLYKVIEDIELDSFLSARQKKNVFVESHEIDARVPLYIQPIGGWSLIDTKGNLSVNLDQIEDSYSLLKFAIEKSYSVPFEFFLFNSILDLQTASEILSRIFTEPEESKKKELDHQSES